MASDALSMLAQGIGALTRPAPEPWSPELRGPPPPAPPPAPSKWSGPQQPAPSGMWARPGNPLSDDLLRAPWMQGGR